MLHLVRRLREAVDLWISSAPREPIPTRTVVVPSERVAHAFRRELALNEKSRNLLVGTRFLRAVDLGKALLFEAGQPVRRGAEELRPFALQSLFAGESLQGKLRYFDLAELRRGPGFAKAFAATIGDLSAAGMSVADLRRAAEGGTDEVSRGRLSDLGTVWESLRIDLLDRYEILRAAAALAPKRSGAVFALLIAEPDSSELEFLAKVPGIETAFLVADPPRPEGEVAIERIAKAFGGHRPPPAPELPEKREISILDRYLFARPEELGDPKRPVSAGADGSVHLEIHSGVREELEAARDWVADEIRRGTPFERMAIIVPSDDPYAGMVADRLAELPWNGSDAPVHVAAGVPIMEHPAGRRFATFLEALESGLAVEPFARLLPCLKFETPVGEHGIEHLTFAQAREIVWNCGTLGGSPERPKEGLGWAAGMERRATRLEELAALDPVPERREREVASARREIPLVRAPVPAVRDLVALLSRVIANAPLAELTATLLDFWRRRVIALDDVGLAGALEEALGPLGRFSLKGFEAIRTIRRRFELLRRHVGRFGEPRIFVGTAREAAGIPFDAVRIVGLAEGAVAGPPVEDPLLPDSDRLRLSDRMALAARAPLASLHELRRVVAHVRHRIVFSAPRETVDRTVREPSGIFLEIAAALRRPSATGGKPDPKPLRAAAVRRDYFDPGREARRKLFSTPKARPASDNLAAYAAALVAPGPGPLDGRIESDGAKRILSASALKTLFECPHRFLFERVLHWEEADEIPDVHVIDALTYGSLFHSVMEKFFVAHGEAFYRHEGALPEYERRARELSERLLGDLVESYPLPEGPARERERKRLEDDVAQALDHEWRRGNVEILAIEEGFGLAAPLEIAGLPLVGWIDRIERIGNGSVMRDWKTGKSKADKPFEPAIDIQLAVYAIAAGSVAAERGFPPPSGAAYVWAASRHRPERAYTGTEYEKLVAGGREWLDLARRLLEAGHLPRTSRKDDCQYCPFRPVCGEKAPKEAASRWGSGSESVRDFHALQTPPTPPDASGAPAKTAKKTRKR